jgi:hypothetical protein
MDSKYLRPILNESLEHRSLNELEGMWKVVHHGNLITAVPPEKTPRLVIYFRKLVNQINPKTSADFETEGAPVRVSVPAAELMRLPLNAIVKNSRLARNPCIPLPSEELEVLDVDFDRSKIKLIDRYAKTYLTNRFIIPLNNDRTPTADSLGGRAYYAAVEHNGDPFGIIIPCAELFRFFYCTSSRMLYTVLSDKILDPDRYIIDPSRSGVNENDHEVAVVWLRQWMANSDRRHVARLFFTEGAFQEAKNIYLRACGYADIGSCKSALIALPPVHNETLKLKCIFKKFKSDGHERIFITRLISAINWTLPFREIHYGRDNDSRTVANKEERDSLPDDSRPQRPNILAEEANINALEDESADNSIDPIEINDVEFESRFPELDKIISPKVEKTDQKTKNNKRKKQLLLADGSLVEGDSTVLEGVVNIILCAMEDATAIKQEQRETSDGHSAPINELDVKQSKLHGTINHLEKARAHSSYAGQLGIKYLPVLDELGLIKGKLVNILPETLFGKRRAFLYLDREKTVRRPVLVVNLSLKGRTRYLVEFMHRYGQADTGSLLLWHPDETPIGEHLLNYAILQCMRNNAVNLKEGVILMNYCGKSLKHTHSKRKPEPEYVQFITKIFTAINEMDKWISGEIDESEEQDI